MTPTILGRGPRRKPGRDRNLTSNQLRTGSPVPVGIAATSIAPSDQQLTVTFDTNVALSGVPQFRLDDGRLPSSATLTTPQTLVLMYPDDSILSTTYTVAADDHAVRSYTGGYLTPGTYPTSGVAAFQAQTFTAAPVEPVATKKKAA